MEQDQNQTTEGDADSIREVVLDEASHKIYTAFCQGQAVNRTIGGIARQTELSTGLVQEVLSTNPHFVDVTEEPGDLTKVYRLKPDIKKEYVKRFL